MAKPNYSYSTRVLPVTVCGLSSGMTCGSFGKWLTEMQLTNCPLIPQLGIWSAPKYASLKSSTAPDNPIHVCRDFQGRLLLY